MARCDKVRKKFQRAEVWYTHGSNTANTEVTMTTVTLARVTAYLKAEHEGEKITVQDIKNIHYVTYAMDLEEFCAHATEE